MDCLQRRSVFLGNTDEENNLRMNRAKAIASGILSLTGGTAGDVHLLTDRRRVMSESMIVASLLGPETRGSLGELLRLLTKVGALGAIDEAILDYETQKARDGYDPLGRADERHGCRVAQLVVCDFHVGRLG